MPLHDTLTVIDGLIVSKWSRSVFESMRRGGLAAANCTCSVWEGLDGSLRNLAQWKVWLRENDDLLLQVYRVGDIARAKAAGKVGIVLGWQNSTGFGDHLPNVALFHELGLRVVQVTYHTANSAGSGCLESRDGGLTDFGRDLVAELNRVGILIDLSHVGPRTARETIEASAQPVAFTHCAPKALKDHPRNRTDEELRFLAERGGVVGVTMFPPFMPRGNDSTIDDYLDAIDHVVNLCGEDHTAIGTDFTQDVDADGIRTFTLDKGYGRKLLDVGEVRNPPGFERIDGFPNLTAAMERRRWPEARIIKLLGGNWLRLFGAVWRDGGRR
ncbi:dipeptidase [Azospirillum sp. TSO22-1]|uniref:dipeptidase n=1 Tax=Azospirillum sp. TSO22-1 TaxID=716789 RepID=UPI000D6061ED|nr:dipeptidase [Azospirillum sp. TSO22-1]PWC54644.1 peptidase M19 [Azospirillum sp. TSO22-1]